MKYRLRISSDGSGSLTGEWGQGKKVRKVTIMVDNVPVEREHAESLVEALQAEAHARGRPVQNVTSIRGGA